MKKLYLFIFLLFTASVMAQEIPNNSFENWDQQILYSDPQGWDTPNELTANFGQQLVTRSDDAHSGSYSVRMESKTILSLAVPGAITLGTFDVDIVNQTADISGGIEFHQRPASLKGYYKTTPATNDSTAVGIYLFSNEQGLFDSIGLGYIFFTETQDEWTEFTVPIEYFSDAEPDTLNIIMVSGGSYTDPKPGSILMVDDVFLEMESGIAMDVFNKVETIVSPNPATNYAGFSFGKVLKNAELILYNDAGMKVHTAAVNGNNLNINLSHLPSGSYVYHVMENNQRISSGMMLKR